MTNDMHVVNCQKVIISCHHTLDLKVILPSIERDIDTNLQARRIKAFKQNWALFTDSSRVPLTPSGPASSDNSPITDALPSIPAKLDISGGGSDAREIGSISSATQQRQLHLPVVCDSQEGQGIPPSGEPEGFEQVHRGGAFQNGGFHMVKDLAESRDWMAKIDLKDAYFLVPVMKDHQKFLQFQWQRCTY